MGRGKDIAMVQPWSRDERGWCVWGVPVDPAWWEARGAHPDGLTELRGLAAYRQDMRGGPGCLAALVAAALGEVRAWKREGLVVEGRRWLDLGGGRGYYAAALRLENATEVTRVDLEPPGGWAAPVLAALGVRVIEGDIGAVKVDADCALMFGVPFHAVEALTTSPQLRLLLTDQMEPFERAAIEAGGWTVDVVKLPVEFLAMSDGCVAVGEERITRPWSIELFVCRGEAGFVAPKEYPLFHESVPEDPAAGKRPQDYDEDEIPF